MRRRYWSRSRTVGRLTVYAHSHSLNLPRLSIGMETASEYVAFSYGTDGSDPVFGVELSLVGTRLGRVLSDVYWAIDRWRRP